MPEDRSQYTWWKHLYTSWWKHLYKTIWWVLHLRRYFKRIKKSFLHKKREEEFINFLRTLNGDKILLCGHQKSGNTWTRFIIFNYFNILINGAEKTLTYDELNTIQCHTIERREREPFCPGFPYFFRTHWSYPYKERIFNEFSTRIYLYRHPLDVLISWYYHKKKRDDIKNFQIGIDQFVLSNLMGWIEHYRNTATRFDLVLNYERMKQDTMQEILKVFALMEVKVDKEILQRSIELSNFSNIRNMGREQGQLYGNHKPDFKGEFTRSGRSHQYLEELKPSTIKKAKRLLDKTFPEIDWERKHVDEPLSISNSAK